MGRSDYLVQAGVGFDIDRASSKKAVGIFEGLAEKLNTVQTKKAKEAFEKTQTDYKSTMAGIKATNEQADKDLVTSTKKSVKASREALQGSMLSAKPTKKEIAAAGGKDEHAKKYKAQLEGMSDSYAKYVKEAEALGLKVTKAQKGYGTGQSVTSFAETTDKDGKKVRRTLEDRKRLIKLSERMHNDEKNKLKLMKEGTAEYDKQAAEVEALRKQHQSQVNLNEELYQQERKTDKIKSKSAKKERKAEKKKVKAQKKIFERIK